MFIYIEIPRNREIFPNDHNSQVTGSLPQTAVTAKAQPGKNQEPGTPSRSPIGLPGAQKFGLSSTAFQGVLTGSQIRSRLAVA